MKKLDEDELEKANFKFNEDVDYKGLWRKRLLNSSLFESNVFFATLDKNDIGMISVDVINDVYKESLTKYKYAVIKDLFVDKDYRDSGIGSKLMDRVKKLCDQLNIYHLELGVVGGNERVLKFYEREGFKINNYSLRMHLKF